MRVFVVLNASFWTIGEEVLGTLGSIELDWTTHFPHHRQESPLWVNNLCRPVPVFTCKGPGTYRCRPVLGLSWGVTFPVSGNVNLGLLVSTGQVFVKPPSPPLFLKSIRGETPKPARIEKSSSPRASCSSSHKGGTSGLLFHQVSPSTICRPLPVSSWTFDVLGRWFPASKATSRWAPGCVRRDGSDCWRSPVSQGHNTGGRDHLPPPPTIASCPADMSRTS